LPASSSARAPITSTCATGRLQLRLQHSRNAPGWPRRTPRPLSPPQLADWKLTPVELRSELEHTGTVFREKFANLPEAVSDARIVAIIRGKYIVAEDLAGTAITVECTDGQVTLVGNVPSHEALGTALRLALETEGAREVAAQLDVTETS
jgi:hypothetical protein